MSKSKMSVVIILCTIISVTAMLKPEIFNIQTIKGYGDNAIKNVKKISFFSKDKQKDEKPKVSYQNVVQSSDMTVKDIDKSKIDVSIKGKDNKGNATKEEKSSKNIGIRLSESAKKDKIKALHESQLEDIDSYYSNKYTEKNINTNENKNQTSKKENVEKNVAAQENNSNNESTNDKSVFKVSKEQIADKLTLSDKQKILSTARKLSLSDYEKINKYLSSEGDEQAVIDAIKLLRDRLSDKDYDKIKEVGGKFLNMDVVEKK